MRVAVGACYVCAYVLPPPPVAKLTLPSVYPLEAGLNTNWDDESLTEEKRKLHYNAKSLSLIALLHIRGVT